MEDGLALAEIREKRELTQNDIAQVLEMFSGEGFADRVAAKSLPLNPR
jgi:hypothetical protein